MIKLNNKNITYVALADSNNSVKGVKEIWYADSANSVKLVYRRKDALIEGEDYEKYHWLEGRNGAYINTERFVKTYEDAFEVYAKYDGTTVNPDGGEQNIFGIQGNIKLTSYIDNNNNINAIIKQSDGSNYNINIHKEVFKIVLYAPNSSEYIKALDDVSYTNPIIGTVTNDTNLKMYVFARNGKVNSYFHGDIAYFRITDTTFTTDKLHLIPCKLLKPVPKWLDANGIRRQVGECGMIDLVSGKFYGNVNSNGTFTVENYYERKEWLVGDGSAYINTKVKLHFATDSVYIKGRNNGVPTDAARYFGNYSGGQKPKSLELIYYTSVQNDTVSKPFVTDGRFGINPNSEFEFYTTPFSSTTSVSVVYDNIDTIFNVNLDDSYLNYEASNYLMLLNTNDTRYCMKADVANFKVMRNSTIIRNLIPCTITMDLPASMDANNIARTKGTSGMWDLVSDKFYGNVANSGTFKAVNLAEGVDYEVHQWLVGDGSAYIDTNVIVNTATLKLKFNCYNKSDRGGCICGSRNTASLGTDTTAIHFQNSQYRLDIISVHPNYQWASKNTFDSFDIDLSTNTVIISGTTITSTKTHTNSSNTFRVFGCALASDGYLGGLNDFIIDDGSHVFNLIPVKLLRSILAKYDANGIARQAGECGMYDTVNDVFYGNVASSGSFSCVNDS